ncbi:MAG: hypothetical protein KatS3mg115_0864 [Candidatus Poribacteria bacterium]|nr:MAG: hypothetical protein KatS3mg115_0864 [Candidatus Poribacteria bacterium]
MARARCVEEDLRFKFYDGDRFGIAYNKGHLQYGDFYLSRPNFYPVYTPSGLPVTTSSAYRFNHHRSIFLGHGKVGGYNFFHDNNPTRPNLGEVALEAAEVRVEGDAIVLDTQNAWITKKEGRRLLTERRWIRWRPGDRVDVLEVTSELVSEVGEITFERDTHAYFGVRVADTIDVEDGGRAVNSKGQHNEEEAMGQFADWVDYSGRVGGRPCGVTLMHHPENPPSPYFVRNYGTMLSNFTLHGPYTLRAGETLRQRFCVLIHDGWGEEIDIPSYHREFVQS